MTYYAFGEYTFGGLPKEPLTLCGMVPARDRDEADRKVGELRRELGLPLYVYDEYSTEDCTAEYIRRYGEEL